MAYDFADRSFGGYVHDEQPQGLSLLFAVGQRPSAMDIERFLSSPELTGPQAGIAHRPPVEEGWLELVLNGLTFDIAGLMPSPAAPLSAPASAHGLPHDVERADLEAIALRPGPHLMGAGAMLPVTKMLAGLAVSLALHFTAKAVCWDPARSWMETNYFARIIVGWLAGGPFPALGLTGVEQMDDGAARSEGLAFFIGQEILVDGRCGEAWADRVRIAVRVIDQLVQKGPVASLQELRGPSGERIFAEPDSDAPIVRVWRGR